MKFKVLLFLMLGFYAVLQAQEPYRSLIITEARLTDMHNAYIELTNMGDETVNLGEFEIGKVGPWTYPTEVEGQWTIEDWFDVHESDYFMLPERDLAPGESYVIANVADWRPEMFKVDPYEYGYQPHKKEMKKLADYAIHYPEPPGTPPADSITPKYQVLEVWNGRDCWYVRHHYSETDSVVIDQVGGVFTEEDGTHINGAIDVAGIVGATGSYVLIRKFNQKQGNIDFESGKGVDLQDSEWIPVPRLGSEGIGNRPALWTIGNHGNYVLVENTIKSNTLEVDFANETITAPWGIRRDDSLMYQIEKMEGMAWHYHYKESHEDSAYLSARTGDKLTIYMCGDELQKKEFDIVVSPPTESDNIVIPKKPKDPETGFYGAWSAGLYAAFCQVTDGIPGMDTIKHINGVTGIAFATRKDSLLKYLEKAPNASWEFIWVDGVERTDLKNGDILRVTAENGDTKDYYIKVGKYIPSHDAYLSSITWPDIPDIYKGILGWIGDTIPNFTPTNFNYRVQIPADVDGIPALVSAARDLNTRVNVKRATNLQGTEQDKTVTFTSIAEDDTSIFEYNIILDKEKFDENIQPYHAEPFISEFIFWEQWSNNFIEICNPGNQPLDLSDYMFYFGGDANPATAIESKEEFNSRYKKYIPGYKWTSSDADWEVQHNVAIQDLNVNPLVQPGDVFVMGHIFQYKFANQYEDWYGKTWWVSEQCDIDFANDPWGEGYNSEHSAARSPWTGANFYLYKILNDSVKQGLKPATDPNDFELVDTWGMGDGTAWAPLGKEVQMVNSFERKPEYFEPKSGFQESFGTTPEESEWTMTDPLYFQQLNVGWPMEILFVADGLGTHNLNEITIYKSTVTSLIYKVSSGYSHEENIRGIITGTTVSDFKTNIIKANADQVLTLKTNADGSILEETDVLANGDSLIVMSADSNNISKYVLEVSDEGLSDDAVLTSESYDISVDGETGTIGGFDYGTNLKVVVNGVQLPAGATMQVIDENGAYVPMKRLNFDTTYVDVQVNDQIFFEVVAEDGTTKITYQVTPNAEPTDAFITSTLYMVDQEKALIDLVPEGTTVSALLGNLVPSSGASIKIIDKLGNEREKGYLYLDDKIVVTASDDETTKIYYLTMLGQKEMNLAYLLSSTYEVDQITLTVYVSEGSSSSVSDILANIEPAPGATVKTTTADGVEKGNDEQIVSGDILEVISGNGLIISNYSISVVTSVNKVDHEISLYPNPASDQIHLTKLEYGSRIQVVNSMGIIVKDQQVKNSHEIISLNNQKSGIYFIVITKNNERVANFKVILK